MLLESSLDNRFDVAFFHLRPDFPVHDRPATAIEQAAEEEEGAEDVDIRNVDVPVLVCPQWLHEPGAPYAPVRTGSIRAGGSDPVRLI